MTPTAPPRRASALAGGFLVLFTLAAYRTCFTVPFVFDDKNSISDNPAIRHLWPLWQALFPRTGGMTSAGRPLVSLSLAVNYAISGTDTWSYHAFNLLVHVLAGLTLFGVARRTFERAVPPMGGLLPGLAVALLWAVHPLQTESVTYIVQRAESMMGLLYLLTLYAFIRGSAAAAQSARSRMWFGVSVAACLLGMMSKEVMVSAPVIVLLYDRAFVSRDFREAWRRHRGVLLGLAATWVPLACLVIQGGGNRNGSMWVGGGSSWGRYALTQFGAVARYLRLAVWPHPLIFDYGVQWVDRSADAIPAAALVGALIAGTIRAWRRGFARGGAGAAGLQFGFLGAWFFAILAPTSLVPGNRQTISEHRMYLALIPVIALAVAGLWRAAGLFGRRLGPAWRVRIFSGAALLLAAGWGLLTFQRNTVYQSDLALWGDTALHRPGNPYAHYALGDALGGQGRVGEAMAEFESALKINPDYADALNGRGVMLARQGRLSESIGSFERALAEARRTPAEAPRIFYIEVNMAHALVLAGRLAEAIDHLSGLLRLGIGLPETHNQLGVVLGQAGRQAEAISHLQEAIRMKPDFAVAEGNLGTALVRAHRVPEGIEHYRAAIRMKPDYIEARANLGVALMVAGRFSEAAAEYERLLPLAPRDPVLRTNYGMALRSLGRPGDADIQFREAERLKAATGH